MRAVVFLVGAIVMLTGVASFLQRQYLVLPALVNQFGMTADLSNVGITGFLRYGGTIVVTGKPGKTFEVTDYEESIAWSGGELVTRLQGQVKTDVSRFLATDSLATWNPMVAGAFTSLNVSGKIEAEVRNAYDIDNAKGVVRGGFGFAPAGISPLPLTGDLAFGTSMGDGIIVIEEAKISSSFGQADLNGKVEIAEPIGGSALDLEMRFSFAPKFGFLKALLGDDSLPKKIRGTLRNPEW